MKTIALALAAAIVSTGAAFAAENSSFSDGHGFERAPKVAMQLDLEPTASIGLAASNDVLIDRRFDGGREVIERYTLNLDGSRNVLSTSYGSSDR